MDGVLLSNERLRFLAKTNGSGFLRIVNQITKLDLVERNSR